MAGYAYVNPLAGLKPHMRESRANHVMAGYAYVNPLAGLIRHVGDLLSAGVRNEGDKGGKIVILFLAGEEKFTFA